MAAPLVFEPTAHVRDLNDAFRRSFSGGRVVLSGGFAVSPSVACPALRLTLTGANCHDSFMLAATFDAVLGIRT